MSFIISERLVNMINKKVESIVAKALEGQILNKEEIAFLFEVDHESEDSLHIQAASRELSAKLSNNLAEIHCHVGINLGPCAHNCKWCSFAAVNKVFPKAVSLSTEEVIEKCLRFEAEGVNAIYLVTTGMYPIKRLIKTVREVRSHLKPDTVLIANADDFNVEEARQLKEAGLNGAYHAIRFREGIESSIPVEKRLATIQAIHQTGLVLGTCVEPIGPEHSTEELVNATVTAREVGAVFSGLMKRIAIPGTEIGNRGMVEEKRLSHLLAVIRLSTQHEMIGMCWHEPSIAGPMAGANLMWAETGSSPRDTHHDCEHTRGKSVAEIRKMYEDAGWKVLEGASRIWNSSKA